MLGRWRPSRAAVITTLLVGACLLLAAWVRPEGPQAGGGAAPAARVVVRTRRLSAEVLAGERREGGFLRAREDVTVSAERAGRVMAFPVAEGAEVKAGTPIAHLDDIAAAASLDAARAAERELSLSPDAAAADLERAQAQLREAEHALAQHHPVSPIAGILEKRHVDAGEYVLPGTPLVDILDCSALVHDIEVDAELLLGLAVGGEVEIRAPAAGDSAVRLGRIRRIATRATPGTRRYAIEIEVPGDGLLRPGMHAEAQLPIAGGAPAFYIAKAAVQWVHAEAGIFLARDGIARFTLIGVEEVGAREDLWRVVSGPLGEGDTLIVAGFEGLRDGAPVEVGS